ncbi:hypothetical protein [Galactobacter valiniphilus]|uniref:Uncharacterized protein n=1 Tax=Galactobacter valiniphilus TaxID=2676122 RepID=A0A399JD34_9MICC|nr:hypothetical protein [Galactobacter valiniphilus]RII43465.1 hypothetical protein DWB68_02365 [Galactobacter valiniphilus]
MRNVLAVLLAALAAISGASAWGGSVVDKALTQPETVRSTLGTLIDDQGVRAMIGTRVKAQVVERLPGGVIPKKLEKVVDTAITAATNGVLEDPKTREAWLTSLDRSRELYVQRVRDEGGSAGRIEVVLDPLATLAAQHVASGLTSAGIKVQAPATVAWRLDQNIGDISPLASLSVPVLQLSVSQSEHWGWYALAAVVLMALALLSAKKRGIPVVTAGFVGGSAGVVGLWASGVVGGIGSAASNPIMAAATSSIAGVVNSTSQPVAIAGGALFVLGIVMLIIGAAVRRRRSVDWEA